MNLKKTNLFFIILLILCVRYEYSQFQVSSHVDMEVNIEEGYFYPPQRILLIGVEDKKGLYIVNLKQDTSKYTVFDVKPGQYLVFINDRFNDIIYQYQTVTVYDSIEQIFSERNTGYLNKVEIFKNRNLKLKISLKMDNQYQGYERVSDIKYKDFDYTELNYSSIPTIEETTKPFLINKLSLAQEQTTNHDCAGFGICGNNPSWCVMNFGVSGTIDDGNIKIGIENAYFKNNWEGEVQYGTKIGNTIIVLAQQNGKDFSNLIPVLQEGTLKAYGFSEKHIFR